jgi:hypothetical protein
VTNCFIHDFANGVGGLRNNYNKDICSDIYRPGNNMISINFRVDNIDKGTTSAHPDFWQCYCTDGVKENCILYNAKGFDMNVQGIFGCSAGCGLKDVAFVNVLIDKDPWDSYLTSQTGRMEHILCYHMTTVGIGWSHDEATEKTWIVKNNNFSAFNLEGQTTLAGASDISHNHVAGLAWNQPQPPGTDVTQGDQGFMDKAGNDFRVKDTSPCYLSGTPLKGVPADIDGVLYNTTTPNRGCYAAGNDVALHYFSNTAHPVHNIKIKTNPVILSQEGVLSVDFYIRKPENVILKMYTIRGHESGTYAVRKNTAGSQLIRWLPEGIKAGMYQLEVTIGQSASLYRVVVLK